MKLPWASICCSNALMRWALAARSQSRLISASTSLGSSRMCTSSIVSSIGVVVRAFHGTYMTQSPSCHMHHMGRVAFRVICPITPLFTRTGRKKPSNAPDFSSTLERRTCFHRVFSAHAASMAPVHNLSSPYCNFQRVPIIRFHVFPKKRIKECCKASATELE